MATCPVVAEKAGRMKTGAYKLFIGTVGTPEDGRRMTDAEC